MRGSYQFEELEGRKEEANLLSERAQLRLAGFKDLLLRHQFPRAGRILEVGCGQGIRTELMADYFPEASIIGIDRSSELLNEAETRKKARSYPQYQEANLYDLPFSDESFDFVYARLVFMHLTDPQKALQSLLRVMKPGGRILIEDADRDCMFFEPAPPSFKDFWEKVQKGQLCLGGDPNVGRKLTTYMKEFSLKNIQTEAQPIIGNGDDIAFLARTLLPSLNTYLEVQDRPAGETAIADILALSKNPNATFYHFWFAVSGEK